MRSNISEQIENALSQEMPIENLRQLAIKLNVNGIEKNEILTAFLSTIIY